MARLPKSVKELSKIEKIEVKDFNYLEARKDTTEVIAEDGREYIIFTDEKHATEYAIDLWIKSQDDPDMLEQLEMLEKPLRVYASERVEEEGVGSIISYDQHHKVKLAGKAIAFRSI
jgi:hypothetical protein